MTIEQEQSLVESVKSIADSLWWFAIGIKASVCLSVIAFILALIFLFIGYANPHFVN